jgi:hypothetical protein
VDSKIGRVSAWPSPAHRRRERVTSPTGRFSALLLRPGVQAPIPLGVPTDAGGPAPQDPGLFAANAGADDRERSPRGVKPQAEEPKLERVLDHAADCSGGWQPGGPVLPAGSGATVAELPGVAIRLAELERVLGKVARRVAWGGDGQRGSARIELELANLSGGILVVHADRHGVDVELQLPPGASAVPWETRIRKRLEARGFSVRSFAVQ